LKKGKKVEEIPGLGITDKYDAEWGNGFLKGKDFCSFHRGKPESRHLQPSRSFLLKFFP
jgi:hypothetical protein